MTRDDTVREIMNRQINKPLQIRSTDKSVGLFEAAVIMARRSLISGLLAHAPA